MTFVPEIDIAVTDHKTKQKINKKNCCQTQGNKLKTENIDETWVKEIKITGIKNTETKEENKIKQLN